MQYVALVGRLLFSLPFIVGGFLHFKDRVPLIEYAKERVPYFPTLQVLGTGVLLIGAGLSTLFGVWPDVGAFLLFIYLSLAVMLAPDYWQQGERLQRQIRLIMHAKNIGTAGAALLTTAVFASSTVGPTLTGPAFSSW